MQTVYLAGPITGLSYDGATDWRDDMITKLAQHNIRGLSPMRFKGNLLQEVKIQDSYTKDVMSCSKGITCRDRNDVMRCDLLFVNFLGAKRVSIGTVMEIAWGDAFRKPIVVVMEVDNMHQHSILREATGFIVPSLEEGLEIIKRVL